MKPTLIFSLLSLFAAVAGVRAAETVYRSPVPPGGNPAAIASARDDWLPLVQAKFDRFGGKHFDIVFDGDSITNRWQTTGLEVWKERYAGIAADFGIEGDRVENVLWRLSKGQLDGVDPKVVVLMIGTNNVGRDTATRIADGIKTLVGEYKSRCPQAHIILMGVFPRAQAANNEARLKMAAVNTQIASLDDGKQVSYVDISAKLIGPNGAISPDMMPDFLHPTLPGYRIWADAIQPIIDKFVAPRRSATAPAATGKTPVAGTALITFSGLYQSPGAAPFQGEIPASYQPLLAPAAPGQPPDGKDLRVTITWEHALCSNRGANSGVQDHTGDERADDSNLAGGVMYSTEPFSVSFDHPVEVPSLFWTYYAGAHGTPFVGSISAYAKISDRTAAKSVEVSYRADEGYVWQQETGFARLAISKLVFNPGNTADGRTCALNIDDITVRAPAAAGR